MVAPIGAEVLTQAILNWLLRGRTPIAVLDPMTGRCVLHYSVRYRWAMALVVVLFIFALIGSIYGLHGNRQELLIVGAVFVPLTLMSAYGAYDAFFIKISFSEAGIFLDRALEPSVFIPWEAISKVSYSRWTNWFFFHAPYHPTIRISVYRSGLQTFVDHAGRGLARSPAKCPHYLLSAKARNPV